MAEKNMKLAKEVYAVLCEALDKRKWRYKKDEEELDVQFSVNGDDIRMDFIIAVDAERQLVRLVSLMPFKFDETKKIDGAIAVCAASYGLADGSFDCDLFTGEVSFRMTQTYRGSKLGDGLFQYMIGCACVTVDKYNDKFLAISKGYLSINDFIASRS